MTSSYSKVQDATQSELALLGYCCSGTPVSMFFAGDNAQTIEEGANFNWSDTRTMGHLVFPEYSKQKYGKKSPLATKNQLEVTGGLRRPPF